MAGRGWGFRSDGGVHRGGGGGRREWDCGAVLWEVVSAAELDVSVEDFRFLAPLGMTGGAWLRLEWEVARSFGLAMFVGGAGAVGFLAFALGLPLEFAALAAG